MTLETIKCPLCDEFTSRQEPKFYRHLLEAHNITDVEELYARLLCVGGAKQTCACGCGSTVKWAGWKMGYTSKFIRGHNASLDSVYLDKERRAEFVKKRVEGYRSGRLKVWNDGLTSETDERIRRQSEKTSQTLRERRASGEIIDWWIKDPEKAKLANEKAKQTKRRHYESGELVPWNKGLTKETSPILRQTGEKIKLQYDKPDAGARIKLVELHKRIAKFADSFTLLSSLENEYKTRRCERLRFRCTTCGKESLKSLAMLEESPICHFCHPKESKGQLELFKFVSSLAPDARLSDRTVIHPKELDVFVPSASLGIEYDGLYWHSELFVPSNHADDKAQACERAGVTLFRVYEDEWRDRRSFIESMIRHKLGLFDRNISADDCQIVELDAATRKAFFDANHIDGDDEQYHITWGLEHEGTIVAAITSQRFIDAYPARFCVRLGTSVAGALGKLSNHVKACIDGKFSPLVMNVDPRHDSIKDYVSAGFKVVCRHPSPRIWWTDFVNRFVSAPCTSSVVGSSVHGCSTVTVTLS